MSGRDALHNELSRVNEGCATGSYSDLVFGLFAICGYQFSPRIADISDARLWRFDLAADYGPLEPVSRQRIQVARVREHWEDKLRVAGPDGRLSNGAGRGRLVAEPSTARAAVVPVGVREGGALGSRR